MVPERISELDTPCLLVEKSRLEKNINSMKSRILGLGAVLRPHVKTAKSLDCARMLFGGGTGPITVSTLREAEYFFGGGFADILYAVSIVPAKLPRVHALQKAGADIKIILDSLETATAVAAYGKAQSMCFKVFIEIDCDRHRAGLRPDDPQIAKIAALLVENAGTEFAGILTHAGEAYACNSIEEIKEHAALERDSLRTVSYALNDTGIKTPCTSLGSSPTARFYDHLDGIDEVRAGVFVFQDLFQRGLGTCTVDDIAMSVLTSVISHRPDQNRLFIDAGALALSKDRGTASQQEDCLYGFVCDAEGNLIDGLIVDGVNQEHGCVTARSGALDFAKYPIGSLLRILPNHACMTAAAHAGYQTLESDGTLGDYWPRCTGW